MTPGHKKKKFEVLCVLIFQTFPTSISFHHLLVTFVWNVTFLHKNENLREFCGSISSSLSTPVPNIVWILFRLEKKQELSTSRLVSCLSSIVIVNILCLGYWNEHQIETKFRDSLAVVLVEANFIMDHVSGCSGYCRCASWDIPKVRSRLLLACYRWDTQW